MYLLWLYHTPSWFIRSFTIFFRLSVTLTICSISVQHTPHFFSISYENCTIFSFFRPLLSSLQPLLCINQRSSTSSISYYRFSQHYQFFRAPFPPNFTFQIYSKYTSTCMLTPLYLDIPACSRLSFSSVSTASQFCQSPHFSLFVNLIDIIKN